MFFESDLEIPAEAARAVLGANDGFHGTRTGGEGVREALDFDRRQAHDRRYSTLRGSHCETRKSIDLRLRKSGSAHDVFPCLVERKNEHAPPLTKQAMRMKASLPGLLH